MGNERKAMNILKGLGFQVERRIRGRFTHDFFDLYDLIAVHPLHGWKLVQVKTNSMPPPAFRALIAEHKVPTGTSKEIWIIYDRVKDPRILILNK